MRVGGGRYQARIGMFGLVFAILLSACAGAGDRAAGDEDGEPAVEADAGEDVVPEEVADDGIESHFAGQTVEIIAGQEAGGAYDLAARIMAPLLEEYLPGGPRVLVVNVPGAGHLLGHRAMYEAEPDGLTIAPIHSRWLKAGLAVELGLEEPIEGFDPFAVRYVGTYRAARRDAGTCINRDVATNWEEVLALGQPVTLGVSERGGTASLAAELIEYQGGPVTIIEGYSTGGEAREAYARGETNLAACAQRNIEGEDYADTLVPLWWFSEQWDPAFVAEMGWPDDIPHFYDVWEVDEVTEQAFNAMVDIDLYSGAWALPPDTPDDIYEAWRTAFEAAATDDRFVERYIAEGRDPGYSPPEPIYELRSVMAGLPDEAVALFAALTPSE